MSHQPGSGMQYFLLKSEPEDYSITDMKRDVTEEWDGIRNYQARNHLCTMNVGDRAFFYHSKTNQPGIVGTVTIARAAEPDASAYDPKSENYDPKSTKVNCRWESVLVEYEQSFPVVLTLKELKEAASKDPDGVIANLALLKQSRLSVVPITAEQWEVLMSMIEKKIRDEGQVVENDTMEGNKRRKQN